ncbi:MAG: tRNA-dihydrouridine synthase [Desulfobacteraceae bacterium]|nr:tRNA-dihydrouridine synthase [Desulfobacteraceae bacterium]
MNFWDSLPKPIFALAPLSGITDSAFRQICKQFGADLVYSELSSATALTYNPERTFRILRFNPVERPYLVQLFGNNPEHFAIAARLVTEGIKPDGIDINFGCPIHKVFHHGAGAALMTDLTRACEVIQSVIENTHLPVSIKVRTRVNDMDLGTFLDSIADLDVKAVMIHGRTYAQGFSGPVDHEAIREARAHFGGIVLANGGIKNAAAGLDLLDRTTADGIGIARGAMGNPWIFQEIKQIHGHGAQEAKNVLQTALRHAELSVGLKGHHGVIEMRKHLCWYLRHLPGSNLQRRRAVTVNSLEDIAELLGTA